MLTDIPVLFYFIGITIAATFFLGVRIVRPFEKGLIERLGKYTRTAEQGFSWIIPGVDRMVKVNITERMVDIEPQMVITKDKLNAVVDAVVYYQIRDVKKSIYNVDDHRDQLTSLARTTLRAVVGKMSLTEANENRDDINSKVEAILDKETDSYGVEVLRVELQKIEPPQDVQNAMNEVVKAEQAKIAASDFASAKEIEADGIKRAYIKEAEGKRQSRILDAQGLAEAIKLENEAICKYFKDKAVDYKKLEVTQKSLANNSKVVLSNSGIDPIIVLGEK